jgi:hypothetical protein
MLTLRPRGKHATLYIRGTVTLGDKRLVVSEYSSGTSDRDAASHLMQNQETKLREELMFGPAASVASGVLADAFASYLSKTPVPCGSDILRIGKLNEIIGDLSLGQVKQGWESFWTCNGLVPVTWSHYATLASKAKGLMPPRYEWRRRAL